MLVSILNKDKTIHRERNCTSKGWSQFRLCCRIGPTYLWRWLLYIENEYASHKNVASFSPQFTSIRTVPIITSPQIWTVLNEERYASHKVPLHWFSLQAPQASQSSVIRMNHRFLVQQSVQRVKITYHQCCLWHFVLTFMFFGNAGGYTRTVWLLIRHPVNDFLTKLKHAI